MSEFDTQFLLYPFNNKSIEDDFDWEIMRPPKRQPKSKKYNTINLGYDYEIPEEVKHMSQEELNSIIDGMVAFADRSQARKIELKNTISDIELELNNRNCFDRELTILENDVLLIRLDVNLRVWASYTYQKSLWKTSDLPKIDCYQVHRGMTKNYTQESI